MSTKNQNFTITESDLHQGVDWWGLVAILLFYALIAAIGCLAAWWRQRRLNETGNQSAVSQSESAIVAGRDIGLFVGIFTMIATWVGGGYVNGTAEYTFTSGLIWVQAPVGYSLSLIIGGLFFAKPMRAQGYLTMLDPFQIRYGRRIGGLLFIPALLGEILWSAAILNALGAAVSTILGLSRIPSVILSACVAIAYTFIGGLYSVAFTDVIQLICIAFGLTLAIPFAWLHPDGNSPGKPLDNLIGTIEYPGQYIDSFLLLIFGGLPWQVYFQRVLSVRTSRNAQILSFAGGVGCLVMAIPPMLIGISALKLPDSSPLRLAIQNDTTMLLPMVVKYMTPPVVGYIALGAVAAAVMSSSDSSILSASSMFAHNIFRTAIWQKAPDKTVLWVLRGAIIVCGVISCILALAVPQVYALWFLSSDLVYVVLFPQLLCAVYIGFVNRYGVLAGYAVGVAVRCAHGVPELGWSTGAELTNWPTKSLAMLANLGITLLVSWLTKSFENRRKNVIVSKSDEGTQSATTPHRREAWEMKTAKSDNDKY